VRGLWLRVRPVTISPLVTTQFSPRRSKYDSLDILISYKIAGSIREIGAGTLERSHTNHC